jgi:DedD protein
MSDQHFHEVQLSGKQLFFLFMCAVVLAGVIFIFGVSVGRGVRNAASQTAQGDVPGDTTVAAETPTPPPVANNSELSYAQALQRRGPDPATVTPPAPPEEPAPAASAKATPTPATAHPPKSAAKIEAPSPKPAPAAAGSALSPMPAPANGSYVLQVGAFGSNDVASREVAKLQRQGHPAKVFTAPEGTPARFKVQVGPFATRADVDKAIKVLRTEGYSPLIRR